MRSWPFAWRGAARAYNGAFCQDGDWRGGGRILGALSLKPRPGRSAAEQRGAVPGQKFNGGDYSGAPASQPMPCRAAALLIPVRANGHIPYP